MEERRDFRQHLEVETPEHVVIDYEIAGLGSRSLAALVDTSIMGLLIVAEAVAIPYAASRLGAAVSSVAFPLVTLAVFATTWGYFALFEAFRDGQTPGKRWMGIRVIRDTGHALTLRDAATRNILRLADFIPPPYVTGILCIAFHPQGKRLGDMVAGTIVVRDRPDDVTLSPAKETSESAGEYALAGAPRLDDVDFQLVRAFAARVPQLPPDVQARLAAPIVARVSAHIPQRSGDAITFLLTVHDEESARRQGPLAARGARGRAGRAPGAGNAMERLTSRQAQRWEAFARLAGRAQREGLGALSARELPDFAARYREVAADLARARTYGADARTRQRLERLVAAGHNLLYREPRRGWRRWWRVLAVECPAAVALAWPYVVVAWLAFTLPAVAAYGTLRERPALAEQVLPATLLERAEAGRRTLEGAARGRAPGYAETESSDRATLASAIFTNNLGVALACFAGGVVLGVGSLVSLAFNGLLIGAASAHFHNEGLLSWLWTFVAGHGVLELFAIWCAGAAGLLLGVAVLRPGPYTRRDALVLNARLALRLVGCSALLLLVAGAIEGFLSASGLAPAGKVAVSAASALLLAAWLANGARFRHTLRLSPVA
jgi:uncharacterized membrane protein SpoIIM required for sporulation/uncharacterized RDD family membrane protein YckC